MRCENPQQFYNKYVGHMILAPCGECRACRITKALRLTALIRNEMSHYKYNIFFTLTYDNKHIPCIRPSDENVYRGIASDAEVITKLPFILDVLPRRIFEDMHFVDAMSLPYYNDVQLFLKKLRNHLNYDLYHSKKAVARLRYVICSEYGTKHYRQHYHGVFSTNSKQEAEYIRTSIPKIWNMCDWDALCKYHARKYGNSPKHDPMPRYCEGFASSYIASYVSCSSGDGVFAKVNEFRSFIKYSKRPIYGLSKFDYSLLKQLQDNQRIDGRVFEEVYNYKHELTYNTISLRLLNAFFPKSVYFDPLPFETKCQLYYTSQRIDAIKIIRHFVFENGSGRIYKTDVEIDESYDGSEQLTAMPIKDGGDPLTNHVVKILKCAERLCMFLFGRFVYDDWLWYLQVRDEIWTKYDSAMLFLNMSRYDPNDPCDYFWSQYKTWLPDSKDVGIVLRQYVNLGLISETLMFFLIYYWCSYVSPSDARENNRLIDSWKTKLLPKHIFSFINHPNLS